MTFKLLMSFTNYSRFFIFSLVNFLLTFFIEELCLLTYFLKFIEIFMKNSFLNVLQQFFVWVVYRIYTFFFSKAVYLHKTRLFMSLL